MTTQPAHGSAREQPLDDFSQCHAGILEHLDALEELPGLLGAAERLRKLAQDFAHFFLDVVLEHHQEEEKELFTAVLSSARPGDELQRVHAMVAQLTREHRDIEAQWEQLRPEIQKVIKGQPARVDPAAIASLVQQYKRHAHFEETQFLPLSQQILGRNDHHMAALGLSLHMRRRPLTDLAEANKMARRARRMAS